MTHSFRLGKIAFVILYYGLDQLALPGFKSCRTRALVWLLTLGRKPKLPRGECLRLALEQLGPISVEFGQVLSTRRDLLPPDVADELTKLQDRVPPFDPKVATAVAEKSLDKSPSALFHRFDHHLVTNASVIQVHSTTLRGGPYDGHEAAVKVLHPGIPPVIDSDFAPTRDLATWIEKLWADVKRLEPREAAVEFGKYLHDELDLMREAANASRLRRSLAKSDLLLAPEVFWDWYMSKVFVMECMHGMRISHIEELRATGVGIHKLACDGMEIFFTQVFRDGFFHADMHPDNILASVASETLGRYITLDFGIAGVPPEFDKNCLAQNFPAFFQRGYHRVTTLYIESGWAPEETRVEELKGAIRVCCELYFDRSLGEISLSLVLMRLFQTSRRFNVEVQPQFVPPQKMLLDAEGLGRQLDPDLDLWRMAKPSLKRWMHEQIGWRGFVECLKAETPQWVNKLPDFLRLVHQILDRHSREDGNVQTAALTALLAERERMNRLLSAVLLFAGGLAVGIVATHVLAWMVRY